MDSITYMEIMSGCAVTDRVRAAYFIKTWYWM